jgi:predicted nucleic acid-binding protein
VNGFLLDTNIPSELTRAKPHPAVERWLEEADDEQLFLSVLSIAEIVRGITGLRDGIRRQNLCRWLEEVLKPWFQDRILPVTQTVAERLGRLAGERDLAGSTLPISDGLIAATALEHDLTITRNVRHFGDLGLRIVNPREDNPSGTA